MAEAPLRALRALGVALVLVVTLSASRPAAASCVAPEPLPASLVEADVVFVGTVVATANRDRVAQVRVEEVWKGPALPEQVEARGAPFAVTESSATSVDRSFRTGVRYLFVPRGGGDTSTASGSPVFEDGLCTTTQEYHPGLDALRPASAPTAPTLGRTEGSAGDEPGALPVLPLAAVAAALCVGAAVGVVVLMRPALSLRRG